MLEIPSGPGLSSLTSVWHVWKLLGIFDLYLDRAIKPGTRWHGISQCKTESSGYTRLGGRLLGQWACFPKDAMESSEAGGSGLQLRVALEPFYAS